MRAIVYLYTSLLLLCCGSNLYADIHPVAKSTSFAQNFEVKQQVKHKNSRHHNVLKESADIEVDEEFHTNDEHNDNDVNKLLTVRQSLLHSWYLTFSRQITFKDCSNNFKIFAPFSVHTNPIYLRIGVFRI